MIGAGLAGLGSASPALAESPIKLSLGGFYRAAYMVVEDDNDGDLSSFGFLERAEPGYDHNKDGFFSDAEIHFHGRTVLDNGLEVGAHIELEGENATDQIDEAWVYFAGGFGEFRIGSDDEALANSCILPPGGTANFSAFSPNEWGANAFSFTTFGVVTNSACTGVDNKSDAQKILYFSPVFYGFQLTVSYTPNPGSEDQVDGVGPHVGMPAKVNSFSDADADSDASVYLTYTYDGSNWGLTAGGGASWEMGKSSNESRDFHDQDFYQAALTVYVDRFSIGGVFEYYNDLGFPGEATFDSRNGDFGEDLDAWVAGGGMAYTYNAWTFGAQYSYRRDTFRVSSGTFHETLSQTQQRAVATVNYALGPGINLDGEVAYTWRDQNPEADGRFSNNDDYQALEFGLGTAVTF
ncbi:MAG: porin [Dongiaceae bacterium]